MSDHPLQIRQGSIIWALVADRNGFRKHRPAVILTTTEELPREPVLYGAAITTTYDRNKVPPLHVPLPWGRGARTGLRKPSAAVCNWIVPVEKSTITEVVGYVPGFHLAQILEQVRAAGA